MRNTNQDLVSIGALTFLRNVTHLSTRSIRSRKALCSPKPAILWYRPALLALKRKVMLGRDTKGKVRYVVEHLVSEIMVNMSGL